MRVLSISRLTLFIYVFIGLTCLSQAVTLQDDPSAKSASIDSTANQDPPSVPQLNPYGINSNGDGFGQSQDAARKRYLDSLAGHIIKRGETKRFLESIATDIISVYPQHKRFLDEIAGNIIRKDADKRYLDSTAGNLIRRGDGNEFFNLPGHPVSSDYAGDYPDLPDIAFDIAYPYLPNSEFGNSLSDGQSYDDVFNAEGFLQESGDYVWQGNKDHEALPMEIPERAKVFKFNDSFQYLPQGQKRYIDAIGGNLIKKHASDFGLDKRYLDSLGSSLIKRNPDFAEEDLSDQQKRYIDSLGSSLIKRLHSDEDSDERRLHYMKRNANFQPDIPYSVQQFEENKRYIDSLGSSLIKKKDEGFSDNEGSNSKRYIDSLGSSLIKKNTLDHESNKRYLDSLGSSLIKKSSDMEEAQSEMESMDTDKRYIDSLGSSLIKKKDQDDSDDAYAGNNKRYIDSLGSSLIKKSENHEDDKRYIDSLGSFLIKKNVEEENSESSISEDKRYIDSLGSSLIKKNVDESESSLTDNKRYLDSLGSSLIKKESSESLQEKRYLDGIGSSLLKREDDKDVLEDDLLQMGKGDSVQKRYLDEIGLSLIKKDDGEKRYLDGIGSSLLKKDSENKRYLDGIGSSLLKRKFGQKRYLDGIGSSLLKRRQGLAQKRYLDSLGSSLIKRPNSEKRYLDDIGSSLIKRPNSEKRYLDDIGSSLIKRPESEKRYIDSLGSSLIKRPESEKRYIDSLGSSLIKRPESEKRYIDSLGSSLIKRPNSEKRYLDDIGSSLIKKDQGEKRYLDSVGSGLIKKESSSSQDTAMQDAAEDSSRNTKRMMEVTDDVMDGSKEAAEAEAEAEVKEAEVKETEEDGKDAEDKGDAPAAKSRRKRDASLLFAKQRSQTRAQRKKRFIDEIASNVLYKRFGYPGSLHRTNQRDQQSEERSQEYKYGTYSSGKDLLQDRLQPSRSPMTGSEQRLQNPSTSPSPSFHYIPREMLDQPRSDYPIPLDQPVNPESLLENPSKFQFTSAAPNNLDLDGLPKSVVSGTFWTFNKVDPIFPSPLPTEMAQPDSYLYGQVLYPHYLKGASQSFSGSDPYAQPGNMDGYHNNQINRLNDVSHTDGNKRYASGHLGSTNLRNHPEVDRVAASIFKNNHVFKRRYMDQLASTLFQKRYLDSLGSNLIKRGGTSSAADTAQDAINFSSDKIRSKRFTMKSSDFLHHKYDINQHISMLKRYIDSIASDLLYKRGPMAPGPSARSLRRSLQVHPGRPEELVIPSMSMESRLRSFQPETAPKGKKLSTSARAFVRRPALSKAMLLTEEAANDVTAPRTYYSQSLNDYVRDVTDQVLTRAKAKESQKLNRGMSGINFVKPGMLSKSKASWKKTENEASEDFFDSVAGALLK